jgi:hypothetical protein
LQARAALRNRGDLPSRSIEVPTSGKVPSALGSGQSGMPCSRMQRANRSSAGMSAGGGDASPLVSPPSSRTLAGSRLKIGSQARCACGGGSPGSPPGKWGWPSLSIRGSGRFGMPLSRRHWTTSRQMAAASGAVVVVAAAWEPARAEHPASAATSSTATMNLRMGASLGR